MIRSLSSASSALLLFGVAHAGTLTGEVVSVHDGDTLTVLIDRQRVRVRLIDIDAPELKQAFGQASKKSLSDLCFGKEATLETSGINRNTRARARVTCAGMDANEEQVRRGMAWVYQRRVETTSPLFLLQDEAQRGRIGLWAAKQQLPPWDWRRRPAR